MANALMVRGQTLPVPVGNLESYIHAIHAIPVLNAEEERELAHQLRDEDNLESAKQLILHNLRFVVKVARGYNGYGLPLSDLVQEGNVGLMKAVKRFDVQKSMSSFCVIGRSSKLRPPKRKESCFLICVAVSRV